MMKRFFLAILALAQAAAGPSTSPTGRTIRGEVVVRKNGVEQKAEAWVYLEDVTKHRRRSGLPGTGIRAEIRQKGKEFVPHVVVIPAGAVVAFPNYDDEEHNVFSPTDPPGQWDLGRYSTDHKGKTHEFDVSYEIDIYCDIHKEMWAKVKVVDSPYIAPVHDGHFEIPNVPVGDYKVIAWTPNGQDGQSEIVKLTAESTKDVTLAAPRHAEAGDPAPHHRKNGSSYGLYKP